MRRFLTLLVLLLIVLSVPSLAAQQQFDNPLQVVDSEPLAGQELALDSPVSLFFNRPLNCDTAANAVSLAPSAAGQITCNPLEASIIFSPSTPYQRATAYTLTVSNALQAQDGTPLVEPYKLEFNTIGNLAVSEVLPAKDSTGIQTDAVITVIFNRPVVPLGIAEDMGNLPSPITIAPAVEGRGEWLNTSIYTFRPDPALGGGTDYTVTVSAGLEAVDGAVLSEPFVWSFRTLEPAVSEVSPQDLSSGVRLETTVDVTFNQAMDQASVEASFYLRPDASASGTTVPGAFEWSEDSTRFTFTPNENLQLDTVYRAGIPANAARSESGTSTLDRMLSWTFSTVPLPAVVGTDPFDGQTNVYPYGGMTIYFASPMNRETFEGKITIDPKPWRDPDFYYYDYDNSLNVSFPTEPSTNYTITIEPGMEDVYGNRIERRLVVQYSTAPYDPDVSLQVPGQVGFYNAYNEKTQLFLTHRNVSRLDLQLYGVDTQDFINAVNVSAYDPASSFSPLARELLRSWQMQTAAPQDRRRYELLDLGGAGGGAVSCPGAPPTRLKVGDSAIVISDPDPVRARATPPDGEVITRLYKDYVLPIIGGPVCANEILWWEVQLREGQTAWVAEGVGDEYFIDLRLAGSGTQVTLPQGIEGSQALPPGVYFLRVSGLETSQAGYSPQTHFLMVSTANLVVKSSINSVLVWATDVRSGEPIANAPITVYDANRGVVGSGVTNADGLLRLDVPRVDDLYVARTAVLQTGTQFGIGSSNWSDGIEPYQFGQNFDYYPRQYRTYLYSDRPIYRPGQPMYFKGIVRLRDDVTYTPPDLATVPVKIYNEMGEIVYEKDLPLTPFGTFSGQFDISPDAGLGYYSLNVELPSSARYISESDGISFGVAEYRVPEFQVNVTPDHDQVVQKDTIKVVIDSRYFFGGAVSNANVDYSVRTEPYFFSYTGAGYYDFTDFNYDSGPGEFYGFYGEQIASGTVTTDAQGQVVIEIPADLKDATQSQKWTIEATVRDESGLTVSGRTEVIVNKGLIYIGVRPESYVSTAGQPANVEIIAVDWDSKGIANQNIDVEVVERRWSSVQEEDASGRTTWTWEVEEIPVTTGSVTTDAQGKAIFTFAPPNGGIFKTKITSRDSAGNEVVASTTMWVSSSEYVSWRQQNSNRIDLIADQTNYSVGDTAEILITSPFQGTTEALVTVERGSVLSVERVTMTSNSYVYKLPISEDFAPNVFVNVLLVKGVDENNPVAAFRMGMIQLGVDNKRKEITVTATPDRQQAGPRETVTYTITTTDYEGKPVQAEVGVALTDLASLSIAPPNSGPILSYYYGQQGLSVRTASPLTINTDQITQTVLDTIKGGGGGGGEGGIFDIRQDFVDTAYWNATVTTDANGEASVSVLLPDNLTTWRLDLRAVTSGADGLTLVGENTVDLLSTKPLLIRPVTPRFVVVGDVVTLAAIVNNNTTQELPVEVSLEGTGFTMQGDAAQTFTLAAGTRQRVEWPVTISDVSNLDLTFFANGGAFTDASKPPLGQGDNRLLPVYKYEAPETVGTAGILREAGSRAESISLPQRFDVTQGELSISLDPSLAAVTIDGLDYLRNYPYQCIEQTVSRFLPNIMTYRALEQLNVANAALKSQLDGGVNFALQRLYAQQKVDGGWGWFVQDDSNPLTTAYALIGLAEAQNAGFTVNSDVIRRAQEYLRTTFIVPGLNQPTWRLNRQAFVLYALARSGSPDNARTATLFESRDRLDYYSKAFLALALNLIDPTDNGRANTLLSDLFNGAVVSATGTHWEEAQNDYWNWNTDTRTTAIVLDALIKLRPDSELIPNVVRWLMIARKADAWETTQETAWAVMALTDWMVTTGELNPAYSYSASLNGESLAEGSATPENVRDSIKLQVQVADLLKDQANALVIGRTEGAGVLYYTAHLRVFLPVPEIEPLNRGIIVERRYTMPGSDTPVTEARVGDLVNVRLTIIAPNDLHYAVIEDPIPAGTEGVNPNLATEQQIGTQPGLVANDPLIQGWGWWWFSNIEFRDEKVVLFSTYLPAGTYEYQYSIRAGLPGTYNVIPVVGYEFYLPEVYGRSAGSTFTILPAE